MRAKSFKERGQILVVVAIGLVALIGFVALAIDGGMIMEERRFDQTVADAASLAGAEAAGNVLKNANTISCGTTGSAVTAARAAAKTNGEANITGLALEDSLSNSNGVTVACAMDGKVPVITVTVMVTRPVNTSFMHFFTTGQVKNTVTSVVEYRPPHDMGFGNTIVALDEECTTPNQDGTSFDGNNNVLITGGGIWSNSCFNAQGTSLTITVDPGTIYHNDGFPYDPSGHGAISPSPQSTSDKIDGYDIDVTCPSGSTASAMNVSGTKTISQGNYSSITLNNKNDKLIMNPGLYCFHGDFKVKGGLVTGTGVTIYMISGNVDFGGNAGNTTKNPDLGTISLTAPTNCPDASKNCPLAIEGLLFYMPPSNSGNITLQGNSGSVFNGLIYAPNGSVDVGGVSNSETTMGVQIVADVVRVHGTVALNLSFDPDNTYTTPTNYDHTK